MERVSDARAHRAGVDPNSKTEQLRATTAAKRTRKQTEQCKKNVTAPTSAKETRVWTDRTFCIQPIRCWASRYHHVVPTSNLYSYSEDRASNAHPMTCLMERDSHVLS
jgi:hypothetical protein